MRLGQIRFEKKLTAALFESGGARPVPGYSLVELIRKTATEGVALPVLAEQMASRHPEPAAPAIPICPVEVWGCGSTYAQGDGGAGGERPRIFFKGTARVCAGPGQPIGIRFDSKFTAPEPELAVLLGPNGSVLGYTLSNDVTARDIESEDPLCLPQAKIFTASCALGPVIVTADEFPDIGRLEIECTIQRGGEEIFSGRASLAPLAPRLPALIEHLLRANKVPAGSVLLTGTGVLPPKEAALAPGDTVRISIPEIGELVNTAAVVQ
jgi:2-dehydro-3-deoxy-D-arabinonate dehydratase